MTAFLSGRFAEDDIKIAALTNTTVRVAHTVTLCISCYAVCFVAVLFLLVCKLTLVFIFLFCV